MPAAPDRAYAGLVSRVAALALDLAIVTAGAGAVRVLPEVMWQQVTNKPTPNWLAVVAGFSAAVLPWLYFTVCWWLAGQTAGDVLVGITVRRRDGGEVSLIQAALRAGLGLLFAPVWIVGLLAILWDERRRAWHDQVFRTVVPYAARHSALASH